MSVQSALGPYKSAIVPSCCEEGCKLNTAGMQNTVILDEDLLSTEIRADCLIFNLGLDLNIGVCELKSKSLDVCKIQEKLTNSTDRALEICRSQFPGIPHHVIPILLTKGYKNYSAYTRLTATKIKIEGKKHRIMLKRCGYKFSKIIELSRHPSS